MKRACLSVLILSVALIIAGTVSANTITLSNSGNFYSKNGYTGGPYIATISGSDADGLVVDASHQFITFCIELNETISFGISYHYTIDSWATGGGVGGATGGKDPLDPMSAWLYSGFRNGTINVPDNDHVKALQATFWDIEDEMALPLSPAPNTPEFYAVS